jgi:hypothetical protein
MKIKSLCILLAAASLLVSPGARAQAVPETTAPTNGVAAELHTLV